MPLHPAWVKNIARRVLWAALERDISKADRQLMAEYFSQRCAYCDAPLPSRWHADHLQPVDAGGFNHISNRVPACPRCNEHEKREMHWVEFLRLKTGVDDHAFRTRRRRIDAWVDSRRPPSMPVSPELREAWKAEVAELARAIDAAWNRLKAKAEGKADPDRL